ERVILLPEPHLDILLERGRTFPSEGHVKVWGQARCCHQNSLLYYATHHTLRFKGPCEVVTGYGLINGLWRQHSWVWDGERVIETTVSRTVYFGVILTPSEVMDFFFDAVVSSLPCEGDACPPIGEYGKTA